MAAHIVVVQRGKKVGWFAGHGPPSNTPPYSGTDYDLELFEPIGGPIVTADSTAYTADNATWPTADGGILEGATDAADAEVVSAAIAADVAEAASAADVLDADLVTAADVLEAADAADLADATTVAAVDVIEPADALDDLDALVIAAGAAVLAEAASAADLLDAEVISVEVPISGGGVYVPPRRLRPVVGFGFGILPQLEGEAHGVVTVAGAGAGELPRLGGRAEGSAGVAGRSAAQIVLLRAAAVGDCGQAGRADAVLKLAASSRGAAVIHGSGSGLIVKFEAVASGQHDDNEAAVMTFVLAA